MISTAFAVTIISSIFFVTLMLLMAGTSFLIAGTLTSDEMAQKAGAVLWVTGVIGFFVLVVIVLLLVL